MSHIHYLTVQDVLWINQKVTSKVNAFDFATLEEATFYQYAYGQSTGPVAQAGRFLGGFLRQHPFSEGNEVTALVGCASFLKLNGFELNVGDCHDWLRPIIADPARAAQAISDAATEVTMDGHGIADPRAAIAAVLIEYADMIQAQNDEPVSSKI